MTQLLPVDELFTVRDFLRYAVTRFQTADLHYGHGNDNPWDEAVQLVMQSLHLPMDNNAVFLDARLVREERDMLLARIDRRIEAHVPVAYLTGEAWFMGLPFRVDERVLVPRSPIAELLEAELQPWLGDRPVRRILDLCAGSGCIGIAAAHVFPEAEVDLVDISPGAIELCEVNIARHGLQGRVSAIRSDLFDALGGRRYDVILSNPPYVDAADMAALPAEYRHEPELGLAAGEDGLDLAHRILAQARRYLSDEGMMVVEVGNSWEALEESYPDRAFTWIDFERGGHGVFIMDASELD
ncbi:MAG: 50S ribosomal protein L3 N(5)-glutamine methyltransferase [Gammaproteobacteria bacterium]|nr:50S ribosomal protein L3 N(5)-glutamine methyltransferase [Gammaproteobacteria bacterium]